MARKKWIVKNADKALAKELAEECEINQLVSLILLSRDMTDPVEIDEFLSDELYFSDPFDLPDMERAVDRIEKAKQNNEKVAVCGDYDADGVTASAILYTYLKQSGYDVICSIPKRLESGYGLHNDTIDELSSKGIKLIVTVDNGISAVEEIEYAKSLGIDTVITDHHLPGEKLPDAKAIVDPHLPDALCEFRDYAGVGVSYMLVCALERCPCEDMLERFGDLAALGTVADMVPLLSENRALVRAGLSMLNLRKRPGLCELINLTTIGNKKIDSSNIAFTIAPRINAAGRMGNSIRAFELLIEEDEESAARLAKEIFDENVNRQTIESEITECAVNQIIEKRLYEKNFILVYGEGWHSGVLGIVAAKLVERFGKPTAVLSSEDGIARGSARSVEGIDLFEALNSCSDILIQLGGHKMAAGLTVRLEDIDKFDMRINQYVANQQDCPVPSLVLDCKLNPLGATLNTLDATECLAPYGCGNNEPIFGLMGMTVYALHPLGSNRNTLKITLKRDDALLVCLKFGQSLKDFPYRVGDIIDLAVTLKENIFKGSRSVTVLVKDIRPSGEDEDAFFGDKLIYDRYLSGEELTSKQAEAILPTRDDMADVFRFLKGHNGFRFSYEMLWFRLAYRPSFGKMMICLDVMTEFGFIKREFDGKNFVITLSDRMEKKNFDNSEIIKKLKDRIF